MDTNATASYQFTLVTPLPFCKIIFKVTELDPAKRYQNAEENITNFDKVQ